MSSLGLDTGLLGTAVRELSGLSSTVLLELARAGVVQRRRVEVEDLRVVQAWADAQKANTTDAYQQYLQKEPNGAHAQEAQRSIHVRYADLDLSRLGFGITVIVMIELSSQAERALVEFEQAVIECPSMSYCSFVSGNMDFLMIVHVRSFDDYDRVYRSELSTLPHVARIRSSFVMREVGQRTIPPAALTANPGS